jgi:hypothetical protein
MCHNILTKRITGIIIMVMIIGTGIFSGCQKENSAVQKTTEEKFHKEQGNGWAIFAADCKGAIAGAKDGAAIGGAIAGAPGAAVGAIVGGVVGGVAASVEKAQSIKQAQKEQEKVDIKDNPISDTPSSNSIGTPQDTTTMMNEASYPINPFDYVGATHYKMVNYYLEHPEVIINDSNEFDAVSYYQSATQLLPLFLPAVSSNCEVYYPFSALMTTLPNVDKTFNQFLNINPNLISILESYEEYSENATNFSDFYSYSCQKEYEVLNHPLFSALEKQMVLSYMATARYGFWYWERALED